MTPDQRAAARRRCEAANQKGCGVATIIIAARFDLPAALAELDRLEALERRLCEVFGIPYPIHDPGGLDWTHFYKVENELRVEVGRLKGELAAVTAARHPA